MEEEKKVEKINKLADKAESILIGCCILAFIANLFLSIVNYNTYAFIAEDVFGIRWSERTIVAIILSVARFAIVGCFIMLGYRILMLYIQSKRK